MVNKTAEKTSKNPYFFQKNRILGLFSRIGTVFAHHSFTLWKANLAARRIKLIQHDTSDE